MDAVVVEAREQARAERHLYALLVLDGLEIPWRAMRGDFDRVDELIAHMASIHERIGVPQSGDALVGALLMDLCGAAARGAAVASWPGSRGHGDAGARPVCRPSCAGSGGSTRPGVAAAHPTSTSSPTGGSRRWLSMAAEAAMYTGRTDLAATPTRR